MSTWYYEFAGKILGPVSVLEIQTLIKSASLLPGTMVRRGEDGHWSPAEDITEFKNVNDVNVEAQMVDASKAAPAVSSAVNRDTETYFLDKMKVARGLSLVALAVPGILYGTTFLGADQRLVVISLYALAALFAVAVTFGVKRLFADQAALILVPSGFSVPAYSPDFIPWIAIRELERTQVKQIDSITFHLRAETQNALIHNGLRGFAKRTFGWSLGPPAVILSQLKANADVVAYRIGRYMEAESVRVLAEEYTTEGVLEDQSDEPVAASSDRPVMSYLLIFSLVLIYLAELAFGVNPPVAGSPTISTLYVLGGSVQDKVLQGQWWRLFTAPLLHASVLHLALNLVALWFGGVVLERLVGRRWFVALFFVSALGGSCLSLLLNAPNTVGVGASGGIVGIFAAVVVVSFRFPSGSDRNALQMAAIRILVPSLLPLIGLIKDGSLIDYAAHLGGAIAGLLAMLVLVRLWSATRSFPRFQSSATVFSTAYLAVVVWALLPITTSRQDLVQDPMHIFFTGQYGKAAQVFAAMADQSLPAAPYHRLWRYIAQVRSADSDAITDLRKAAEHTSTAWPYPVFQLFLGELDEQALLAKAANGDQTCEAVFYTGETFLIRNMMDEARKRFEKAAASCPKNFMEYYGAKGELKLMDGIKENPA